MTKFFMVFVEGEHTPTFKHESIQSAEKEAQRLTELTGKKSYVLATIKSIELPSKFVVTDCTPWSDDNDDLPF